MYLWLWLAFTALAGATDVGKLLSVLIKVINILYKHIIKYNIYIIYYFLIIIINIKYYYLIIKYL